MRATRALAIVTMLSTLALGATAGASLAGPSASAATGLRFTAFPKKGVPGKNAKVGILGAKAKDTCGLSVHYANGASQPGLRAIKVGPQNPLWTFRIPADAHAGTARITASCKATGSLTGLLVVEALPLRIDVLKQGFSVKSQSGRSTVSYGVVLANRSKTEDAQHVVVLVNFVNANDVLIGSKTTSVAAIPAASEYALGDYVSFQAAAPVSRLEVVVRVTDKVPAVHTPVPGIANIRIVPDLRDPDWIGEVDADLSNASQDRVLKGGTIRVVVMNAAGEIVGGGSGSVFGTLPPGARQFVKVTQGVDSIGTTDAASARFTVEPRYETD